MPYSFSPHRPFHDIGVVPNYSPAPVSAPEPETTPADPIHALEARLESTQRELREALRLSQNHGGTPVIAHRALAALNTDLAAVKALNARRPWGKVSSAISAWPEPVFPINALLGVRDLLPALSTALVCLAGVRADAAAHPTVADRSGA